MGLGITGVLCYVDENGERAVVSFDNPLPTSINGEAPKLFVATIVSK